MIRKIENRFLANYILMFLMSIMIAMLAYILLGFANDVISKTLIKNNITAEKLMKDDFLDIDTKSVTDNGGGIQVINSDYEIVFSKGLNTFSKDKLTIAEFTDFLVRSQNIRVPFSYNIKYNSKEKFWLLVTFPTSLRIDFAVIHNKDFASVDMQNVVGVFVAIAMFYLILLAICTIIYSKLTSISIINPLKKLCNSARRLKDGDYSTRVELNLKNEFGELESIFNEMAKQIENEISLRKQSEENRKKLILDISHDLKNPLASVIGYSELCLNQQALTKEEYLKYIKVIYENGLRANSLITDLFELSRMDSSGYKISKTKIDICEYLREKISVMITTFDMHGFIYEFEIPENEIYAEIDVKQMDRVFQNLTDNEVQYNPKGTKVIIHLFEQKSEIVIIFKDNGIGIPSEIAGEIFQPFVRVDNSRNSQTGGTGLGLAITQKIIAAHGGNIHLKTEENFGCEFTMKIPKI